MAELYKRTHFPKEINSFYLTLPLNGTIPIKITINLGVRASHLRSHHLALTSMSEALSLRLLREGVTFITPNKTQGKFLLARLDPWK